MLTFAIPTWNRVKQLERCIKSIQAEGGRVLVSDHGSTDGTVEMLEKLGVEYVTLPRTEKSDFQDNFRHVFSLPETEWTWMFGDDDLLRLGSLQTVLEALKGAGEFLRVAEKARASESPSFKRGTLLEVCSTFGWLDMTGFITGNIVKTERLRRAVNNPKWEFWSKNAFPQSCALLEELRNDQAMFLDLPIIDSQEKAADINQRWEANNTALRYFFVDESLTDMVQRGILPKHLDNVFFRYHSYFLWDRLISNMISDYSTFPDKPQIHLWKHIEGLAELLADDQKAILKNRILEVQQMIERHQEALESLSECSVGLRILNDQHNTERFGWTYTGEPKTYTPVDEQPVGAYGFQMLKWNAQKRQRDFDVEILTKTGYEDQAKTLQANQLVDFS